MSTSDQNNTPQPADATETIQRTILIIDDEPVNAHLISQLLKQHNVIVALNGYDGIDMALDQRPDLILLDINMPGMRGFEVCERLRANPVTVDTPILFLTTVDALEDKVRGFAVGGHDYIVKPYSKEEVVARVNTHLALRHLRLDLEERNRQLLRYKGVLEQLVVERLTRVAEAGSRSGEFHSLLTIIETIAQIDDGHRGTAAVPRVTAELDKIREDVRDMIRRLGPSLRHLREVLDASKM
ncbi:MAG: response regulator [Alphaproteobacteria bacterium]|nr:response regulator [Alphaproteobacteria bacterium]